jgi:hypothetical protein
MSTFEEGESGVVVRIIRARKAHSLDPRFQVHRHFTGSESVIDTAVVRVRPGMVARLFPFVRLSKHTPSVTCP